jgi:DNA-binding FrmR family transcriptional regulator
MINDKRECGQIIQQITSIKKAIDGLAKELMVSDICKYVPEEQSQKVKEMVEQAIKM